MAKNEEVKKLMDNVAAINLQLADLSADGLEKVAAGSLFFED